MQTETAGTTVLAQAVDYGRPSPIEVVTQLYALQVVDRLHRAVS